MIATGSEIRYAKSGGVHVAYQLIGDGPRNLVFVPGFVSNLEVQWELPDFSRFVERLASFSRVILFDKRGTGLSDRVPTRELPTLEERMDDVRAVMDGAGVTQAVLFGVSEGGPLSVLFAATQPSRSEGLVLYGSYARRPGRRGPPPSQREPDQRSRGTRRRSPCRGKGAHPIGRGVRLGHGSPVIAEVELMPFG